MEPKKIIILPVPAMGHMSTVLAIAKRLIRETSVKLQIYGTEELKAKIEETGSTWIERISD